MVDLRDDVLDAWVALISQGGAVAPRLASFGFVSMRCEDKSQLARSQADAIMHMVGKLFEISLPQKDLQALGKEDRECMDADIFKLNLSVGLLVAKAL